MNEQLSMLINQLNASRRSKVQFLFENIEIFFESAPASTKYHGNFKGGLLSHTLNVIKIAKSLFLRSRA